MPHLIDKETGLCVVCQRNELAAIKEGKKYKRQNYDLRKFTIEETFDPKDPHYRDILNRHYVKYDEYIDQRLIEKHEEELRNLVIYSSPDNQRTAELVNIDKKVIMSDNLPVEHAELITSDKSIGLDGVIGSPRKLQTGQSLAAAAGPIPLNGDVTVFNNAYRETLRKVNLADAYRVNNTQPIVIEQEKIMTPRTPLSRSRARSNSPYTFVYSDTEAAGTASSGLTRKRSNSFNHQTARLIEENPHQSLIGDTRPKIRPKPVKRYVVRPYPATTGRVQLVQPPQTRTIAVVNPSQTGLTAQPKVVFKEDVPGATISARKQILPNNNIMMVPYHPPEGFRVVKSDELASAAVKPTTYTVKSPTVIDIKPGKGRVKSPTSSTDSEDYYNRQSKKLLSGFHPYYDKETDIMALQCCTCCIGCWRRCSRRCTGCENFMSCPIYCWICILLPIFLLLLGGLVVSSLYAAKVIG